LKNEIFAFLLDFCILVAGYFVVRELNRKSTVRNGLPVLARNVVRKKQHQAATPTCCSLPNPQGCLSRTEPLTLESNRTDLKIAQQLEGFNRTHNNQRC